jgi:Fic family protein
MFEPKYTVNNALLANLVKIKNLIAKQNDQKFPELVLAEFQKDSHAVSAFASTSIEGNPLALTDVRRLLKNAPERVRDTEREVLNYNTALQYLDQTVAKPKAVTVDFICTVQGLVIDQLIEKKNQGKIRKDPVVVNDPKLRKIIFIPPNADEVPSLLQDTIMFLDKHYDSVDPLILAGLFHKQFVIIHPFIDGNGRTARLVTKYLLARMGLDTFKLFSFENYYNQNVTKYFNAVGVQGDYYDIVDKVDFTDWLVYFTDGIIDELLRVQKLLLTTTAIQRNTEYEKTIVAYIREHGSISESEYSQVTKRARSTRILDFKRLVDRGILERCAAGKASYYVLVKK